MLTCYKPNITKFVISSLPVLFFDEAEDDKKFSQAAAQGSTAPQGDPRSARQLKSLWLWRPLEPNLWVAGHHSCQGAGHLSYPLQICLQKMWGLWQWRFHIKDRTGPGSANTQKHRHCRAAGSHAGVQVWGRTAAIAHWNIIMRY